MQEEISWEPSASITFLRQRSQLMAQIRQFFLNRHYWEVETPIMARYGVTDVYLSNIKATFRGKPYCLQTSPEYHMKRLLAAGSGSIFQLARVFRDDEFGRWHNPEFTLLEWYRVGIDHHALLDEVDALLQCILQSKPAIRMTYRDAFLQTCGMDPFLASIEDMKQVLVNYELDYVLPADETDRDQYLFLFMSHIVEPGLGKKDSPVAVYDFPPSQAALAQIRDGFAERFEVYYRGVELANGFHELIDVEAQAARFEEDKRIRQSKGFAAADADPLFLQALAHGLPACSGVALGVDRLLALALGLERIAEVMAFDFSRA